MSGKMKIYGILMMAVMLFVTSCTTGADEISVGDTDSAVPDAGADQMEGSEETAADQAEIKLFVLEGGNYYFEMDGQRDPVITVKQGDRIRVELTSVEGYHDFVVDEFDAATSKVWPEDGMTYI